MGNPSLPALDRRAFMAMTGVVATAAIVGCSSDDDDTSSSAEDDDGGDAASTAGLAALPGGLPPEDVPSKDAIFANIQEVFSHGIRRPGYEADIWVEEFLVQRFQELGLENVRTEPVPLKKWEPNEATLEVTTSAGETVLLDCFPLPYTANAAGLEVELALYDETQPDAVAGKASLREEGLLRLPPTAFVAAGGAPADPSRVIDPDNTFADELHVLPFGTGLQDVMEPSIEAGAVAFVGSLKDYPGDSYQYFVPYDGIEREIPGVWIKGSDGTWLREQMAAGPVTIRLTVDTTLEEFESHNVVGELPGADDEVVMLGSHHDGPWASAVEDGSGISLVLAQAEFWAAQPADKRPHRLVFVLHGGHMCGGAGLLKYIQDHEAELDQVVLQIHLEHACLDFADQGGELVSTGQCVPRWWFVSRNPTLEAAVTEALVEENLTRSMLLSPTAIGAQPPTDGAFYYNQGVPITHFLSAPFYLFDEMDQLDKIDQENLVPLTRATIRIVESTRGVSAADMRAGVEA